MTARLSIFGVFVALVIATSSSFAAPNSAALFDRAASASEVPDIKEASPVPLQNGPGTCVSHRNEARYRALGYDHLVHITNACTKPVSCLVSTNVARTPVQQDVPAQHARTVLTFRGSPARAFSSTVTCKFQ